MVTSVSPSRKYVAQCIKGNFDGYYFRSFTLPEKDRDDSPLENNSDVASWYFLNRLDFVACIEGVMSHEDYSSYEVTFRQREVSP